MELPIELNQAIEENASEFNTKALIKAASIISERYRAEKGDGSRLVTKSEETAAYSVVRMPATYGAVHSALENAERHTDSEIISMTDVGSGTGAAVWAALDIFVDIESITCLERESEMTSLGKKLMENGDFPISCSWKSFDIVKDSSIQKADLVTVSYMLNELSENDAEKALLKLWDAADKLLVIVEPGTKAGFRNIQNAQKILKSAGAEIAAPCPIISSCPLPADDWCHFTVRVARTKLHKLLKGGDVPYEDEKFCYTVFSKTGASNCKNRILRHPKIESGKITLELCSENGLQKKIVTKKDGSDFKKARKSDCGDDY